MSKSLVLHEKDVQQQIITSYKQYLIAQKRKNTVDINQSYARMGVWRSIFDEMNGDTTTLDTKLEQVEKTINA